jgi:hypothetical protein
VQKPTKTYFECKKGYVILINNIWNQLVTEK